MMDDEHIKKLKYNIWMTYKSRIYAEKRYKKYERTGFFMIQSTSMSLILLSVFSDNIRSAYSFYDNISVAGTIIVFSVSLILWGAKFSEVAAKHRDCYLDLQNLQNTIEGKDNYMYIAHSYDQILRKYPNHDDIDYLNFLFDSIVVHNQKIYRNNESKISINFINCADVVIRKVFWGSIILFGIASIAFPLIMVVS